MIRVKNLKKVFKEKDIEIRAVDDVTFDVEDRDIFGIMGYSGAGKSTLVRCLNLLEVPDSGFIEINGKVIFNKDDKNNVILSSGEINKVRQKMGMIFQHFNLFDRYTVYDNIAFPLKNQKVSKDIIDKKVKNLLRLVNLTDKEDAYPCQLSGGQKQRVAIARALVNDPEVILSDEATSALDPDSTLQILELLKKINKELGITIIVITHEMQVIKNLCNKVVVIEKGKIVEEGNVYDVFANPKMPITMNFINSQSPLKQIDKIKQDKNNDMLKGGTVVKITFSKDSVGDALISDISRRFNANINIILANVEIIDDKPLGALIASIDVKDIKSIIDYLHEHRAKVEVLSNE